MFHAHMLPIGECKGNFYLGGLLLGLWKYILLNLLLLLFIRSCIFDNNIGEASANIKKELLFWGKIPLTVVMAQEETVYIPFGPYEIALFY